MLLGAHHILNKKLTAHASHDQLLLWGKELKQDFIKRNLQYMPASVVANDPSHTIDSRTFAEQIGQLTKCAHATLLEVQLLRSEKAEDKREIADLRGEIVDLRRMLKVMASKLDIPADLISPPDCGVSKEIPQPRAPEVLPEDLDSLRKLQIPQAFVRFYSDQLYLVKPKESKSAGSNNSSSIKQDLADIRTIVKVILYYAKKPIEIKAKPSEITQIRDWHQQLLDVAQTALPHLISKAADLKFEKDKAKAQPDARVSKSKELSASVTSRAKDLRAFSHTIQLTEVVDHHVEW